MRLFCPVEAEGEKEPTGNSIGRCPSLFKGCHQPYVSEITLHPVAPALGGDRHRRGIVGREPALGVRLSGPLRRRCMAAQLTAVRRAVEHYGKSGSGCAHGGAGGHQVSSLEIDYPTLREESTQLISKMTLERRHPDMIWSAETLDSGRVVFLIEFQRTVDPLMALRTTTYTALTLEGIASDEGIRVADRLPESSTWCSTTATARGASGIAWWTLSNARPRESTA